MKEEIRSRYEEISKADKELWKAYDKARDRFFLSSWDSKAVAVEDEQAQ
jgi:hypothetical protein